MLNYSIIHTKIFNPCIKKILIYHLPKNFVVVINNTTYHQSYKIKDLLEINIHQVELLVIYLLDLNPIKNKYFQAKNFKEKERYNIENLCKDDFL